MNRIELSCEALETVLPPDLVTHVVKPYLFQVCTKCQQYMEPENPGRRCEGCLLQLCFDCNLRGTEADFHIIKSEKRTYCVEHSFESEGEGPPHNYHSCSCEIELSQQDVVADLQQRRREYKAMQKRQNELRKRREGRHFRNFVAGTLGFCFAVPLAGVLGYGVGEKMIKSVCGKKRSLESTPEEETNPEKKKK